MADSMAASLHFLELFPECRAWDVVILDQQKKKLDGDPSMATATLRSKLSQWMALHNVHIFVRPLLGNLVFLDLDGFFLHNKGFEQLLQLRPRALVKTSEGNYQAWLTLPQALATQHAVKAAQDLTALLHGDHASVKPVQQGRLPGSVNVKQGKGCRAELVHGMIQDLDAKEYLKAVPRQFIAMDHGKLQVRQQQPTKRDAEAARIGNSVVSGSRAIQTAQRRKLTKNWVANFRRRAMTATVRSSMKR